MVKDRKAVSSKQNQFFALKVQKSAEHYTEAAMDEVELLDCISKERNKCEQLATKGGKDSDGVSTADMMEFSQYVATLHDSFFHTGPNGRHMCMVFTMLGCNLLSVIKAYNYRGIPIPVVKNMIQGICKGLDFLHRKCQIIHTDLKPENVLLLFEGSDEELVSESMSSMTLQDKNSLAQSIRDLEVALENTNLSPEERKKLKRRLKKKRQKERRKASDADGVGSDDGSDGSDDEGDSGDEGGEEETAAAAAATAKKETSSFLSDWEMSKILGNAASIISPRNNDSGLLPSTPNVKRRLSHSAFVTSNFGHRQVPADTNLMELLKESAKVKRPSPDELSADLRAAEKNGGVAEVSFMMRAFTPEEELADGVSAALGGIGWEASGGSNSTREWYVLPCAAGKNRCRH